MSIFIKATHSILVGLFFVMIIGCSSRSSPKCLKSLPGDSESFGHALAMSDNYLAIGDPKANRVVIYTRGESGKWLRTKEILPPKNSPVDRVGSGFGYSVALNKKTLFVGAYIDPQHQLNNYSQYKGSVYYLPISSENINSIKEIKFPQTELVVGYSLSIADNKIAIGGRILISPSKWIGRILIADTNTGQIEKVIEAPNSQDISDDFGSNIDGYNEFFLIGTNGSSPRGGAYLATIKGNLKEIPLNDSALPSTSIFGSSVTLTDNLMAIGGSNSFGASETLLLKQSQEEWSLIDVINLSGSLDAYNSHILISAGSMYGMPSPTNRPDHLLIKVSDNKAIIKSIIRWKSGDYFPIEAKGIIDSDHLLLSQQGKVVHLPMQNLPSSFTINQSSCEE